MRAFAPILGCSLALAACDRSDGKPAVAPPKQASEAELLSAQSAKAAELVKAQLKDPDSARFRNVRTVPFMGIGSQVGDVFCGEVNARNSMGGYTGFESFAANLAARQDVQKVFIVEPSDASAKVWHDLLCLKDGKPIPGKDVTLGS
jgi:hypothetical protein